LSSNCRPKVSCRQVTFGISEGTYQFLAEIAKSRDTDQAPAGLLVTRYALPSEVL
jgi:hypothetical protein